MSRVEYAASIFYTNEPCEQLCRLLVDSTNGLMGRAYIVGSGKGLEAVRFMGVLTEVQGLKQQKLQ